MKTEQISIFLENRAGSLYEVIRLLAAGGVGVKAMSLADTSDYGVLRLIADDPAKAFAILSGAGFAAGRTRVVAVAAESFDALLRLLAEKNINVEYMYAYIRLGADSDVAVFRFDKMDEAIETLTAAGFRPLTAEELRD